MVVVFSVVADGTYMHPPCGLNFKQHHKASSPEWNNQFTHKRTAGYFATAKWAATLASSLAITRSAGTQSPAASDRAMAANPSRTNSVCSLRRETSVRTALSTKAAIVSPASSDCSIASRKAGSTRMGGMVAVFMVPMYFVCNTWSTQAFGCEISPNNKIQVSRCNLHRPCTHKKMTPCTH